jgi:predicted membrane protein
MIKLFKNITFQSIIFYTFCCLAVLILDYFFPGGSHTPGFGILIIPLTMIIALIFSLLCLVKFLKGNKNYILPSIIHILVFATIFGLLITLI